MSKVIKTRYATEAQAGLTPRTATEEAARCLLCHDAPCSTACPAGTDPGKFIRSIRFRNPKGAAEIIRENNILGGSCARICPYDGLCEEACSRCGIDKPIQIRKLQRYAMEQEAAFKMKILKAPAKKLAGKIACVGAGPASLACAAELAKEGYRVTVFEAKEKPGGVLTYGITSARLPQPVVNADIAALKNLGVKFVFGAKVGKDIAFSDIKSEFDAVFIGAGLWDAAIPPLPGAELKGVYTALQFLENARSSGGKTNLQGKTVIIIGGGDVALDCATTAKLTGAADVAIYYRRSIEEAPGGMEEFQYALSLGVSVTTNFAPAALVGKSKLQAVEFTGRDGKSSAVKNADVIIFATGQRPEDMGLLGVTRVTEKGLIKADKNGGAGAGIFAAGDAVNGGKTVVEAVAAGKNAAKGMSSWLTKKGVR